MHFSTLFVALGGASILTSAIAGPIQARQVTAAGVVTNIETLTTMSQNLQVPASSINLLSGPLFLIGQGPFPQIVVGFAQIVSTVTSDISAMRGTQPFNVKSDQDSILNALTTFVKVHQELLNILIGKAGILNDLPLVGPPVAQALRSLEGVVDTLAFGLIDMCADVATKMTSEKDSLDKTISQAITVYTPIV